MAIQLGARVRLLALLVAFYTPALRGGAEEYDGKRIMEIRFDPVRQPLPRTVLDGILPLKVNGVLHMEDVTAAIQRLFATGRYADIAVDALAGQDGVILRFLTEQSYFIGNVSVSGVPEPPNKGQLVAATKLRLGTEFVDLFREASDTPNNLLKRIKTAIDVTQHTSDFADVFCQRQKMRTRLVLKAGDVISGCGKLFFDERGEGVEFDFNFRLHHRLSVYYTGCSVSAGAIIPQ